MAKRGKNYKQAFAQIERQKEYPVGAAIEALRKGSWTKFDQTVEVAVNLGVNPRHADQMVRGAVVFPNGLGKSVRVAVFAKGAKDTEAREAGADIVGAEDLVARIKDEGFLGFDKVIATPDMMGVVGRIGRILGPRGLMPNPKVGTVTFDVAKAIGEMKAGRVEFRVDKAGIVHAPVGKMSFETGKLVENVQALIDTLNRLRPASSKGVYMKKATITTTMGPGIRLDLGSFEEAA